MSVLTRLLAKIKIDQRAGCWEWTAAKLKGGYGIMLADGRVKLSHRISYELHRGPIPHGLCVCHSCDNRACINPSHLFLGTQAENIADMLAKGRKPLGIKNYNAKLTNADVLAIRSSIAAGAVLQKIADEYGVSRGLISHIKHGRNRARQSPD